VLNGPLRDYTGVPLVVHRKDGCLIEDLDGNTFADHVSAWGASPYGAQPPQVRSAVNGAWDRYGMEISNYLQSEPVVALAERLVAIAPGRISRVASPGSQRPLPGRRPSRAPSSSPARPPGAR
jgi:4-aminobutyrate aminotransferase-like enzyme